MTGARIIDGTAAAFALLKAIGAEVDRLRETENLTPGLAIVLVGDDAASRVYLGTVGRQAKETGIAVIDRRLPADIGADETVTVLRGLNKNRKVHGTLLLRPLPDGLDERAVADAIDPEKDIDGLHAVNGGRLLAGVPSMVPCTALACLRLVKAHVPQLAGKRAVVVGRSVSVGKPAALLLSAVDCTVVLTHRRTADLADECRRADILIASAGEPHLIKGDWIKPGATVIDVGINRVTEGRSGAAVERTVGDVDFEAARLVAGAITPVPGGVGPMTVACQLLNTLAAACRQRGLDVPAI